MSFFVWRTRSDSSFLEELLNQELGVQPQLVGLVLPEELVSMAYPMILLYPVHVYRYLSTWNAA